VNDSFDRTNKNDRNLVAKLGNTVSDLNFYCYRFLLRAGYGSSPRTGLSDAEELIKEGKEVPPQVNEILNKYSLILKSNPKNANGLFYQTWKFLHEYDKLLNDGIF
jgi:hypothetical protein